MATRAEPAAEDRGLTRVWGLVAGGAPPQAVEDAVLAEARALAGAESAGLIHADGAGFDPTVQTDRLGLAGIRERVALLDGTATFGSRPGEGTTVVVEIPA